MAERLRRQVPRLALNQQEAAEALGVSVDTFARYVQSNVPCVFIGSRRVFAVEALQRWLDDEATLHGRRFKPRGRR